MAKTCKVHLTAGKSIGTFSLNTIVDPSFNNILNYWVKHWNAQTIHHQTDGHQTAAPMTQQVCNIASSQTQNACVNASRCTLLRDVKGWRVEHLTSNLCTNVIADMRTVTVTLYLLATHLAMFYNHVSSYGIGPFASAPIHSVKSVRLLDRGMTMLIHTVKPTRLLGWGMSPCSFTQLKLPITGTAKWITSVLIHTVKSVRLLDQSMTMLIHSLKPTRLLGWGMWPCSFTQIKLPIIGMVLLQSHLYISCTHGLDTLSLKKAVRQAYLGGWSGENIKSPNINFLICIFRYISS